jgi:hypothetical protein
MDDKNKNIDFSLHNLKFFSRTLNIVVSIISLMWALKLLFYVASFLYFIAIEFRDF